MGINVKLTLTSTAVKFGLINLIITVFSVTGDSLSMKEISVSELKSPDASRDQESANKNSAQFVIKRCLICREPAAATSWKFQIASGERGTLIWKSALIARMATVFMDTAASLIAFMDVQTA